jgi:hypothetical protein
MVLRSFSPNFIALSQQLSVPGAFKGWHQILKNFREVPDEPHGVPALQTSHVGIFHIPM